MRSHCRGGGEVYGRLQGVSRQPSSGIIASMRFVDDTTIAVQSGKGGDGIACFRREKNRPLGGPDGGDGGDGGNVVLRASENVDTLLPLARTQTYVAGNGERGRGHNRRGRSAEDVEVEVPLGTVVERDGRMVADLAHAGEVCVVARGGRGGRGNAGFASATNQAPETYTRGEPGESARLHLELKLIADVGLVGLPNSGKSTLLSRLSAARPKIADYPFTTMQPQLGIVSDGGVRELVMADIPGLIEGAAAGAGLGSEFLRHVERCGWLVHLVDLCPLDGSNPADNLAAINRELAEFSPVLARKPQIIVGTKLDLPKTDVALQELGRAVGDEVVLGISAVSGAGLRAFVRALFARARTRE